MPPNRQLSLLRSLAVSHGQLTMLRFVAPPDSYLYEPWFVFVQNLMRICCGLNFSCLSWSQSILIPKALDSNCKNQLPTSDNFKWLIALICFASKLLKYLMFDCSGATFPYLSNELVVVKLLCAIWSTFQDIMYVCQIRWKHGWFWRTWLVTQFFTIIFGLL